MSDLFKLIVLKKKQMNNKSHEPIVCSLRKFLKQNTQLYCFQNFDILINCICNYNILKNKKTILDRVVFALMGNLVARHQQCQRKHFQIDSKLENLFSTFIWFPVVSHKSGWNVKLFTEEFFVFISSQIISYALNIKKIL